MGAIIKNGKVDETDINEHSGVIGENMIYDCNTKNITVIKAGDYNLKNGVAYLNVGDVVKEDGSIMRAKT